MGECVTERKREAVEADCFCGCSRKREEAGCGGSPCGSAKSIGCEGCCGERELAGCGGCCSAPLYDYESAVLVFSSDMLEQELAEEAMAAGD